MIGSYRTARLPDFRKGERLKAEDLQTVCDVVRSLQKYSVSGSLSRGSYGGVVDLRNVATTYPAKAPAGGIAALSGTTPGSADCTRYTWDGTDLAATGDTVTVRNPYASAVGANKFLWVVDWEGATWVVAEACT